MNDSTTRISISQGEINDILWRACDTFRGTIDATDQKHYVLVILFLKYILHGMNNPRIEWGDTLLDPKLLEGDKLTRFEVVVANPPFSLDKWGADHADNEKKHHNYPTLFLPDLLWQAKPINETLDMRWLAAVLELSSTRKRLRRLASGSSGSMPNVSKRDFLVMEIPIPTAALRK